MKEHVSFTSSFTTSMITGLEDIIASDNLSDRIIDALNSSGQKLIDGDILVIASKVVSITEDRICNLQDVTPSVDAIKLGEQSGKDSRVVEMIMSESEFLTYTAGPIVAVNKMGLELSSAGIDRIDDNTVILLPIDPDVSAGKMREHIMTAMNISKLGIIIADSDGRADRGGSTVISIGSSGIDPLRRSEWKEKVQEETIVDLVAASAGIVLGQQGRGAPVVLVRGVEFEPSTKGLSSILHADRTV